MSIDLRQLRPDSTLLLVMVSVQDIAPHRPTKHDWASSRLTALLVGLQHHLFAHADVASHIAIGDAADLHTMVDACMRPDWFSIYASSSAPWGDEAPRHFQFGRNEDRDRYDPWDELQFRKHEDRKCARWPPADFDD